MPLTIGGGDSPPRVTQTAGSRAQNDGTIPVAENAKSAICAWMGEL